MRKIILGILFPALTALAVFARPAAAQNASAQANVSPLTFGNNFFVTGDYVVAGAQGLGVNAPAQNGFATGTITIPDLNPGITGANQVPPGAQIVSALLYWQTVEKATQPGTGQNGFFRPVFTNGPKTGYPISGATASQGTVSFSGGGCTGSSGGKVVKTYRAEVRGYLPQDASGNIIVNGTDPATSITYGKYEVLLANNPAATLPTLGATLVIIYRVLSPDVPLNSIVIYDGSFAPGNNLFTMTQKIQGFYQAAQNPVSRLTHIVGSGHNYKFQTVYLNSVALPNLYATNQPFPGYYGSWDNTTWTFDPDKTYLNFSNPVTAGDSSATTMVVPSSSQAGCVSWGAVIVSTTVQNTDGDGLLDVWKTNQGYCDAAINEGSCTHGSPSTGWVALPGAAHGQKDVFVQLDYMCSVLKSDGTCDVRNGNDTTMGFYSFDPRLTTDPLDGKSAVDKVMDAFEGVGTLTSHTPINLHVVPTHAIQELTAPAGSVPTCTDIPAPAGQPNQLCAFPNQAGVVGWKGGLIFLKNQLVDTAANNKDHDCTTSPPAATCVQRFQHGKKDSWHYALFGHALGLPTWTLGGGTLTSVVQSANTVTFTTSTPHGLTSDPSCSTDVAGQNGAGRVTVAFAITNSDLNGTYCVTSTSTSPANTAPDTFTISVVSSKSQAYTFSTDPDLAVASGLAGTVSGFSDVGGQDSLITLGSWKPQNQTWQAKTGTFMHELGHTIGLTHGGFYFDNLGLVHGVSNNNYIPTIEANCKANDQSVMSYSFQIDLLNKFTGLDGSGNPILVQVPDYSGQTLDSEDKTNGSPSPVFNTTPTYPITAWHGTQPQLTGAVGSRMPVYCDGTPIPTGTDLYRVFRPALPVMWEPGQLSWVSGQDINLDGNTTTETQLRGHNDWTGVSTSGLVTAPGIDLRQIGATGSLSAAGVGGLSNGGGTGGLSNGGGAGGLSNGGGASGLSNGGGVGGLSNGGGANGLSNGGGTGGLSNGGGQSGLSNGGGSKGEMTQAIAESFTRPPTNLVATEATSARTITLTWVEPSFGVIGAYRIFRSADGGATFTLIATVAATQTPPPGTQPPYFDHVTCNPRGYQYYVKAVLAGTFVGNPLPNPPPDGQESVPSNIVTTGQNGKPLTGCYTNTPNVFPTPPLSDLTFADLSSLNTPVQGDQIQITWSLKTDDTGVFVQRTAANTAIRAIGPIPSDAQCAQLPKPPAVLGFNGTYPYPVADLTAGIGLAGNGFAVTWDTTTFNAGCYFFELDTDSKQSEISAALTLLIFVSDSMPHITTTTLPPGVVGSAYNNTVFEAGGVGPFVWTVVPGSGALPPGISLNSASGVLSGTPCAPGNYTFTVKVTDFVGNFGMQTFMLSVTAAPVPQANQPLVPESSVPGASGFTLTVNGTGFVSCSAVLWNGGARTTIFKSATQLTAAISAADVLNFGTAPISVATTGSPSSNVDFFQITNPTTAVSLSRADIATGMSPQGVIAADFNGDGKLDLAIANSGDKTVSILLGNGDGTFIAKPTLAAGNAPNSIIAGDFNNDGKLDLAVTNFTDGNVSIFIGNGDGTFKAAVNYAVGSGPFSVVTGDFKGHGKLDLAVANQNDHTISILLGNGDGTFQLQATYAAVIAGAGTLDAADLALGDFNGDGKLDLAVTNPSTDQVSILLGNGDGTFQNPVSYATGPAQSHPIAVTAADFNGDGKLDLAVTNLNTRNVAIFLGNGNGTFQPQVSYSTTGGAMIGPSAITTGDFNGDGKVDLAITNQNDNSVSILLGNGDGTFQSQLEFTTGNFSAGVAAGDFNGDGRLDVAVANQNSNTVSIMLQPQVLLVPSALAFGSVAEGAPTARVVNLTNNGPGALTISTIVINPGAFSQINNCPITPTTLAPGATCTINVSFGPTVTGVQGSTLVITDNARDTPQNVSLTGSGFVAPPTNLAANTVAGSGAVTLAWSASVSASGGYNVYRATVSGGPYVKIKSSVATTGYMDSGLTSGTTYYYVTTAMDASANESAFSNQASATP